MALARTEGSTSYPGPRPARPGRGRDSLVGYLAIGHVTVDRLASGQSVGGSAAYASVAASRLGVAAAIVTVAAADLDISDLLPGIEIARSVSQSTTTFENSYRNGHRVQRILAVAESVSADAVPTTWRDSPIVHIAPVDHEVGGDLPGVFPDSLIGLTPQGLLREWDRAGWVRQGRWRGEDALLAASQVVMLSDEDLSGDPDFLALCLDRVPVTVLTRGARGATLFADRRSTHFPAYATREVDPTGAGDVFAAAFLVEYHRTGDARHAAAFACCAASFAVERPGLEGVPDRESVEHRLARYT